MSNALDILKERGFIQQVTYEEELWKLFDRESVTFYVGFDPTADSLHIGHYIPIMAMAHLQRAGHKPIALVGGGTGMVGDPSGKTDMRKLLTKEDVAHNCAGLQAQLSRFVNFDNGQALLVNNGDWLLDLNYVEFLREVGAHFSVNRMLTAECFKQRMEKGLSFLEFNYMLMQAYDFLMLNRRFGCKVEMGGDDQWSNMLAGADLIRRKERTEAYAMTFALLTNSEGVKMGKTVNGALWLDANRTSPYEFYQYFRNVADPDVQKCLAFLTFLPMDEVRRLGSLPGAQINEAKRVLAFEATKLVHGEQAAREAQAAAEALFAGGADAGSIPTTHLPAGEANGLRVVELLLKAGLTKSLGEGRRLIGQGGVEINGAKVREPEATVSQQDFPEGTLQLKKGKKAFHRCVLQ